MFARPNPRRNGMKAALWPSFAFYNTSGELDVYVGAVRRGDQGRRIAPTAVLAERVN